MPIKMKHKHLTVIAVYASEEGRVEDSRNFYDSLQKAIRKIT